MDAEVSSGTVSEGGREYSRRNAGSDADGALAAQGEAGLRARFVVVGAGPTVSAPPPTTPLAMCAADKRARRREINRKSQQRIRERQKREVEDLKDEVRRCWAPGTGLLGASSVCCTRTGPEGAQRDPGRARLPQRVWLAGAWPAPQVHRLQTDNTALIRQVEAAALEKRDMARQLQVGGRVGGRAAATPCLAASAAGLTRAC
jgi:hypothetical protein